MSNRDYLVASDERISLQCESYLEVDSRDYLIASDKHILFFGSWFRNLPKGTKTRGKVSQKLLLKLELDL